MDTNSLISNAMIVNTTEAEFKIGDGATICLSSDRHACTIISWDGKIIAVQQDIAKRIDKNGMSEDQTYEYTADPQGPINYYRKNTKGQWVGIYKNETTDRWNLSNYAPGLVIGMRNEYYDFSF